MRILKVTIITISFLFYLIIAAICHIGVTFIRPSARWPMMSYLSYGLISFLGRVLGLRINLSGHTYLLKERGHFIIGRHLGYLDGIILGSLTPATFISKKEIKGWPLIGKVVQISGTIFIDRQQKIKIAESMHKVEQRLKQNMNVFAFPEGTSTAGDKILPFQAPLFGAPINTKTSIVPLIIHYRKLDGEDITIERRDEVCWYNKMNFPKHLWNILKYRTIDIDVMIEPKIVTTEYMNSSVERKRLAQECHATVVKALQPTAESPSTAPESFHHNNLTYQPAK